MLSTYVNLVKVYPGDTLINADGEEWLIPDELRYILIEDGAKVLPTGDRWVRTGLQKLRIHSKAARQHPR